MAEDKTFKRLEYKYRGEIKLKEHKLSELLSKFGPGDILVKVKAASINPVDFYIYNTAPILFFKRGTHGIGRDFAGIVEKVGPNVKNIQVGDRIAGIYEDMLAYQGSFGEYLLFNPKNSRYNFGKIPDSLSFTDAASFPLVFGAAYTTLTHHHKPTEKTRAIVYGGATSVGSYVIQILKQVYNAELIVSVNSEVSAERVKRDGADIILNYRTQDVAAEAVKIVEESGKKFDIIIDTVGNNVFFPKIEQILKPKSEGNGYVSIAGDKIADYTANLFSNMTFGSILRAILPKYYNYQFSGISDKWFDLAIRLYEEGKLNITIDSVHPLEKFSDAYKAIIGHKAQGKVVLSINDNDTE